VDEHRRADENFDDQRRRTPLLHAGALIDVMDALPQELRSRGHEVAVTLPIIGEIRDNPAFKEEDTGSRSMFASAIIYIAEYLQGHSPSGSNYFFVRCDEFFDRDGITVNTARL